MMKLKYLPVIAAVIVAGHAMACYTVHAPGNRVVYNGELPPIDMSLPLHTALQQAHYPAGSTLMFDQSTACRPVSLAQVARAEMPLPAVASNTAVMGAGPA